MKKLHYYFLLVTLSILVGCSGLSKYSNEDVAAIVRGEEITVGELRFLTTDDQVLEQLDGWIKAKLAMQEVEKLNIDMTEHFKEINEKMDTVGALPPEDVDLPWAKRTREFAEEQSKKFGMEAEEFYRKHMEKSQEISAYVVAYIQEMIGEVEESENLDKYTEKANQLLDDLVEANKDKVEIFIK